MEREVFVTKLKYVVIHSELLDAVFKIFTL